MTEEAKIEEALVKHKLFCRSDTSVYDNAPPLNRKLSIGESVEVGNLDNCVVVALRNEDKAVVIRYSKTDNNYGNPIVTDNLIGVWSWMDVISTKMISNRILYHTPKYVQLNYSSRDISGLTHSLLSSGVIDNQDYQRGYVWTYEDKLEYIESIFNGRDIGKFVLVEDSSYRTEGIEILDGKQRVNAIMEFMMSHYEYGGRYWHQLSKMDRHCFENAGVQVATLDSERHSRADMLKTFLNVNAGGVPQTNAHLQHVRVLLEEELTNAT